MALSFEGISVPMILDLIDVYYNKHFDIIDMFQIHLVNFYNYMDLMSSWLNSYNRALRGHVEMDGYYKQLYNNNYIIIIK